jgi:hypothetical protein
MGRGRWVTILQQLDFQVKPARKLDLKVIEFSKIK